MGYVSDYNELMADLKENDKRTVVEGKRLRGERKSLDPFADPNMAYTNMMAELGAQRNAMRVEAESLYREMSHAEKQKVSAPYW
jgi:hypothetical protein